MKKQRQIKRIFLYDEDTPTVENYEGAYKFVKAISDDEKHSFEFTVNQDDYENSLNELCEKFERFCTVDCGFDDDCYCEVWSAFCSHSKIDHIHGYRGKLYTNTLDSLLISCTWATVRYMESDYCRKCSHLRKDEWTDRVPTFEEFATAHGYKESDEPYATKKLFGIYTELVDKQDFTADELLKMQSFVSKNLYLYDYLNWTTFVMNLADFFLDNFDIDFFDEPHFEMRLKVKRYISDNLQAMEVALIRLHDYDKKTLKLLLKKNPWYKRHIKQTIKYRKIYEEE